jgi:hypothetical protein
MELYLNFPHFIRYSFRGKEWARRVSPTPSAKNK